MEPTHEVAPFPHDFCGQCCLNGCYPWNGNPLLLCSLMGGLYPTRIDERKDGSFSCLGCHPISEDKWQRHLDDLRAEARLNETLRHKAMDGKVYSSDLLPAERYIQKNKQRSEVAQPGSAQASCP